MSFYSYDRMTRFAESDAAGIIHFSTIACYTEEAEHSFYWISGFPIQMKDPSGYRWPRVRFSANYKTSILPFQKIRVILVPLQVGNSSITWSWKIINRKDSVILCDGEMKSVCCILKDERLQACPLPQLLRAKLLTGTQ